MNKTSVCKGVIVIVFSIILSLIFSLAMIVPAVNNKVDGYNKTSYYENSNFDFMLHGQTSEQTAVYKDNNDVESVAPFFYGLFVFKDNTQEKYDMYAFADKKDLAISPFTESRLLEEKSVEGKEVYVDAIMAKSHKLSLGTKVEYYMAGKLLTGTVARIYEPIVGFDRGYMVSIYDKTEMGKDIANSLYIKAKDVAKVDELLKSYQPLLEKKSRDEFKSDESYQAYLDSFNSVDYYATIEKLDKDGSGAISEVDEIIKKSNGKTTLAVALMCVFMVVVVVIVNILFMTIIKTDKIGGASLGSRLISSGIFSLLAGIMAGLVGGLLVGLHKYTAIVVPSAIVTSGVTAIIIGAVIGFVAIFAVDAIMLSIAYKSGRR